MRQMYFFLFQGDKDLTSYCEDIFSKKDAESTPFMTTGIEFLIEKLEKLDEFKKFVPHLKNVEKDNLKKCIASAKSYRSESPKGIFVLNHGDFHVKNIMTKRNKNEELEDVMLFDFQMCSFGPAILDVMYGIYMLCDPSICINNFDEIMYFYSSNFIDTLKELKFEGEIPNISDFYIELYRHRHFALFLIASFAPMWYALFDKQIENMNDVIDSDEERKKMYGNLNYLRDLKPILQSMFYRGYLE
ncbi:uncharacterized protein LOC129910600 [Episyrphus balteatus]|uniref:uncharacterized protein LOC129910600 n=1 Tax=Episyrphus balteatus TaxID=286459 RepID=UPI002485E795|nr:uncharacterized protein LOC129910600 [Episyrphus balteatus]